VESKPVFIVDPVLKMFHRHGLSFFIYPNDTFLKYAIVSQELTIVTDSGSGPVPSVNHLVMHISD
jgi:hypothetical protein